MQSLPVKCPVRTGRHIFFVSWRFALFKQKDFPAKLIILLNVIYLLYCIYVTHRKTVKIHSNKRRTIPFIYDVFLFAMRPLTQKCFTAFLPRTFLYPADKININASGESKCSDTVWVLVTFNMLMLIILSPGTQKICAMLYYFGKQYSWDFTDAHVCRHIQMFPGIKIIVLQCAVLTLIVEQHEGNFADRKKT